MSSLDLLKFYHQLPRLSENDVWCQYAYFYCGHAGINRMMKNIKWKHFWRGIQEDITAFVKHYESFQRNKHINLKKQPMILT